MVVTNKKGAKETFEAETLDELKIQWHAARLYDFVSSNYALNDDPSQAFDSLP